MYREEKDDERFRMAWLDKVLKRLIPHFGKERTEAGIW